MNEGKIDIVYHFVKKVGMDITQFSKVILIHIFVFVNEFNVILGSLAFCNSG